MTKKRTAKTAAVVDVIVTDLETNLQLNVETGVLSPAVDLTLTDADLDQLLALDNAETVAPVSEPDTADVEGLPEMSDDGENATSTEEPSTEEPSDEASADESEEPLASFASLVAEVTPEQRTYQTADTVEAFDERDAFERTKGHYDSISKSLNKSRAKLLSAACIDVMIAAEVSPFFVNRSMTAGSGYNVYAIDKVADIVAALSSGHIKNAINRAIILSLFAFEQAGVAFTGEMAKAAASDKIRVDQKVRALLTRHIVSASTAPTQASSTMSALQTLGVVHNIGGQKSPVYVLTRSSQTERLREIAMPIAA